MPGGTALFSNSSSRNQNKNLVEFKAGKMTMKGKMVHPDKRKGLVYIFQSEDSLMHFCWKDRTSNAVEDDLIIFPDDVEFKRVPQCTTGRVYILKFKSSNRKFFFWVQEAKTDKDEENCRKVNEVLNNPPSNISQRSGGATPDSDLQNLLSNMSQQQLMQLFGGVGQIGGLSSLLGSMNQGGGSSKSSSLNPSSTPMSTPMITTPKTPSSPASSAKPFSTPQAPKKSTNGSSSSGSGAVSTPTGPTQADPVMLSQLQSYLSNLGMQPAATNPDAAGGASAPQQQQQQQMVDLASAVTSDTLQSVMNNPDFVKELQKHLPSVGGDLPSQEQLKTTLQSPQFQQALSLFSQALQSGQLGPTVSQFEMGTDAVNAANSGNMEEFIKALQQATISSQPEASSDSAEKKDEDKNKKKNDDEDMNLD